MKHFVVELEGKPVAFYNDAIHPGRIPEGAREIDEETYHALLASAFDEQPLELAAASSSPASTPLEDVLEELVDHVRELNPGAALPKATAFLEARRAQTKKG